MATRSRSVSPHRLFQGVFVVVVAGGIALNLLVGQALLPAIVLSAWLGALIAGVGLVAFVCYLCLAVLDVV